MKSGRITLNGKRDNDFLLSSLSFFLPSSNAFTKREDHPVPLFFFFFSLFAASRISTPLKRIFGKTERREREAEGKEGSAREKDGEK